MWKGLLSLLMQQRYRRLAGKWAAELEKTKKLQKKISKEPLKMLRAENYPDEAAFVRHPNDPKGELVGRWFTTDPHFVDVFSFPNKGIKTLTVRPPIEVKPGVKKSINELLQDRKALKDWVPYTEGAMGAKGARIGKYFDPTLGANKYSTQLEYFLGNPQLRDMITLTPPRKIAQQAKFDPFRSLMTRPHLLSMLKLWKILRLKMKGYSTGGIVSLML